MISYLILDAGYINPPSERFCIRNLTLYSQIVNLKSLLIVERDWRDLYWKSYKAVPGLLDYVEDMVSLDESPLGIMIAPELILGHYCIPISRLTIEREPFLLN